MRAQTLLELIGESAPEEGVVDLHELEASFSGGAVVAEEITAEPTRRMSTAECDAALVAAEGINGKATTRMSAVQSSELAALIAPPVLTPSHEPVIAPSPAPAPLPRSRVWMLAGAVAVAGAVAAIFVVA